MSKDTADHGDVKMVYKYWERSLYEPLDTKQRFLRLIGGLPFIEGRDVEC